MACRALRDMMETLADAGQLARITAPVHRELEVAAITAEAVRRGGPALLFAGVSGGQRPLATNVFTAPQRLCRVLEAESLEELSGRLFAPPSAGGWLNRLAGLGTSGRDATPRPVRTGAVQQVVKLGRDIDLAQLPAPRSWPRETHAALTAGVFVTLSPDGQQRAAGIYDLALLDRAKLAVELPADSPARRHLRLYAERGERMPVAVVLGGDPALSLIAAARLPGGWDPYEAAGIVAGGPLEVVTCRAHAIQVPAHVETVLEGWIDPQAQTVPEFVSATPEGIFATVTGAVAIELAAVTERVGALLPAMIYHPGSERTALACSAERLLLPMLKDTIPELVDFNRPAELAGGVAILSIRKEYPAQARRVASAFWGAAFTLPTKLLVIVDADVAVDDPRQVLRRALVAADPECDLMFPPGGSTGAGLAVDATAKLAGEAAGRTAGLTGPDEATRADVLRRWVEYGIEAG